MDKTTLVARPDTKSKTTRQQEDMPASMQERPDFLDFLDAAQHVDSIAHVEGSASAARMDSENVGWYTSEAELRSMMGSMRRRIPLGLCSCSPS